ncbi:MAG: hypothetical protein ACI9LX_000163 [Paraglaciecola sp.]|jgi:hypothetical protein
MFVMIALFITLVIDFVIAVVIMNIAVIPIFADMFNSLVLKCY